MKQLPLILSVFILFISCCDPCNDIIGELPGIYSISFSPKTAEVGDTIEMYIDRDFLFVENFDYDKNFEITSDGKIKYTGSFNKYFSNEEDRFMKDGNITRIASTTENNSPYVEVTEYVSIKQLFYYPEEEREIVLVEFKVPAGAKSGYIRTSGPFNYHTGHTTISNEKLTIVDADGNEIK